jgi:hypothetical protein
MLALGDDRKAAQWESEQTAVGEQNNGQPIG